MNFLVHDVSSSDFRVEFQKVLVEFLDIKFVKDSSWVHSLPNCIIILVELMSKLVDHMQLVHH